MQSMKPSPNGYIYKMLPHLRLEGHCGRKRGKMARTRGPGSLLWDYVSSNIRRHLRKLGEGEVVLPQKNTPIGCPVLNSQSWKHTCKWHYTDWTIYTWELYLIYTYMHAIVIKISAKGHEGRWRKVCKRVWGGRKRKWGMQLNYNLKKKK